MIKYTFPQYSDEWWEIRRGRLTASKFKDVCSPTGKISSSLDSIAYYLACELIIKEKEPEAFTTYWMTRGLELEPKVKEYYSFMYDREIVDVGFITKNDDCFLGCSPDGIIDGKYGLEIKCPSPSKHLEYLTKGVMPTEYRPQVYGSLYIADELEKWVFMSYHPDMEPFVIDVTRDSAYQQYIDKFTFAVEDLENRKEAIIKAYQKLKGCC